MASHGLMALSRSLRWHKEGLIINDAHWSTGKPVVVVFWHCDQLLMPWIYRPRLPSMRPLYALVSLHADGRIASAALQHFSVCCVDGSSTRGGARALVKLRRRLEAGCHVAITPDGPKGPARIAKIGAIVLSSMCGAPLFPVAIAAKWRWQFPSWDSMFLPRPFSRIVMLAGAPIAIPPNLTRDELDAEAKRLTDVLNGLKERAELSLKSFHLPRRRPASCEEPIPEHRSSRGCAKGP